MNDREHKPVLVKEVLAFLAPQSGDTVVDCTAGLGGHSLEFSKSVGSNGCVIGFDLDQSNLIVAEERVTSQGGRFVPVHANFVQVGEELIQKNVEADIVLADLGVSSNQLTTPSRGFSFSQDGPLDMRLDPNAPITAADLIARMNEAELADLIFEFGEDPLARRIAQKLTQDRQIKPIRTTAKLAELVKEAYGKRGQFSRIHPATRTFMALRIAVNDEMGSLRGLLDAVCDAAARITSGGWLRSGARIGIISFHSLEDRLVKRSFHEMEKRHLGVRLTKKPITPGDDEIRENPRARSAKFRAFQVGLVQNE